VNSAAKLPIRRNLLQSNLIFFSNYSIEIHTDRLWWLRILKNNHNIIFLKEATNFVNCWVLKAKLLCVMAQIRNSLFALLLLWAAPVQAQNLAESNLPPRGKNGNVVNISTPLILDVNSRDASISFNQPEDFQSSKVVKNCFHIKVQAPDLPWAVTAYVTFEGNMLDLETAATLARLVQLRINNGLPIRMADRPQAIIQYNPNNPNKNYEVDLIVDPPFNVNVNSLKGTVSFRLQLL
jgi:hypothetical protein